MHAWTVQVQRPGIEPIIYRDLWLFRTLASLFNWYSLQKLGCNGQLIVDEFGEKLLEELDYTLVCLSLPPQVASRLLCCREQTKPAFVLQLGASATTSITSRCVVRLKPPHTHSSLLACVAFRRRETLKTFTETSRTTLPSRSQECTET